MKQIMARHSSYIITGVDSIPKPLEYRLCKYNKAYFRMDNIGLFFDKKSKELRIPRGYPESHLKNIFREHEFSVIKQADESDKIDIHLKAEPRDFKQRHVLTFLCSKEPYQYTKGHSQLYVDLDTGDGKTYCGIATQCYHKTKMLIITPAINKVMSQWYESTLKFTDLRENEVLLVRGSEKCDEIIDGKYNHIKTFIIPRSTLLAFVRKYDNNWAVVSQLVKKMNVGLKIQDEAHLDFNTIVNIECFTNTSKTIFMSSSPSRSDDKEKEIYGNVFQLVPRLGKSFKTKEMNHIIIYNTIFKAEPTPEQIRKMKTPHGISQVKYEHYLVDEKGALDETIDAFIFTLYHQLMFRRNAGRVLVLSTSTEFAKVMAKVVNEYFPMYTTGLYIGSGKDKHKELDRDIIFSTAKGMGTGSEIVNHQFTINCITYSSDVAADQMPGRNRKNDDTRVSIYSELVNTGHPTTARHYTERKPFLMKKAKNGTVLEIKMDKQTLNSIYHKLNKQICFDENGLLFNFSTHNYVLPKRNTK